MKKGMIFIAVVVILTTASDMFAQWQLNGNNIYYNSGNVGIGTNLPTHLLSLSSTESQLVKFERTGGYNAGFFTFHISDGAGTSGDAELWSLKGFAVRTNNGDRPFAITQVGLVGINTRNPTSRLEIVDGDIFINGINRGIILKSPNGTNWKITVDNSGNLTVNPFTSVNNLQNDYGISIFPNPAKDHLTIELRDDRLNEITAELYNMMGTLVFYKKVSNKTLSIDLNEFASGAYLLNVKDTEGNVIKTEKIIH